MASSGQPLCLLRMSECDSDRLASWVWRGCICQSDNLKIPKTKTSTSCPDRAYGYRRNKNSWDVWRTVRSMSCYDGNFSLPIPTHKNVSQEHDIVETTSPHMHSPPHQLLCGEDLDEAIAQEHLVLAQSNLYHHGGPQNHKRLPRKPPLPFHQKDIHRIQPLPNKTDPGERPPCMWLGDLMKKIIRAEGCTAYRRSKSPPPKDDPSWL